MKKTGIQMNIQLLEEPELEFGNSGRHVDIRFGIKTHGPVSIEDPQAPKEIKLGIVGTAATIEKLTTWLDAGRNPIAAKESRKPNLFPSFPGFAPDRCFHCDWTSSADKLQRTISPSELKEILEGNQRNDAVKKIADRFIEECRHLTSNNTRIQSLRNPWDLRVPCPGCR